MQHIETVPVGSGGAASITFSAIPDTFTDLFLTLSNRSTANSVAGFLAINGVTTNRTFRYLLGNGSTTESGAASTSLAFVPAVSSASAGIFGSTQFYFPNYRSNVAKSFSVDSVNELNGIAGYQFILAGLWNSTDAITSLTLTVDAGSFAEHSSASLYGILAGSDGTTVVS